MSPNRLTFRLIRLTAGYFGMNLSFALINFLLTPLLLGLLAQSLFDHLARGASLSSSVVIVVAIGAVQVGAALSGPALLAPWSPLQQKAQVVLRRNAFAAIMQEFGHHDTVVASGDVVSRLRDDPALIVDQLDCICDLIGRSSFLIVAGVVVWNVDSTVTLILLAPIALTTLLSVSVGRRLRSLRAAARSAAGGVSAFLAEIVAAQLAVKVAGASERVVGRLNHLSDSRRKAQVRTKTFDAFITGVNLNVGNLGAALMLLAAAGPIARHQFSVGDIALFVVFLAGLNWFPDEVERLIGNMRQIEVSVQRIHFLAPTGTATNLSLPPLELRTRGAEGDDTCPDLSPLEQVEVCGLTYRHGEGSRGVVDISFVVPGGSLTVLTGRVGSGKSTVLRSLLGLVPIEAGQVRWNGEDIADPGSFLIPPRAAYTPQDPRLFTETLQENVLLGWTADEPELQSAVHAAVLEEDIAAMVQGMATPVGPRGVRLSGGQTQRVAAARMFVRRPQLLVIDDLSSALDAHTEAELWRRFFQLDPRPTALVVTHRPAVIRRADQVLEMVDGRVRVIRPVA